MRKILYCLAGVITILVLRSLWGSASASQKHTLTGNFKTHKNFHSKFLARDRDIIIYLPPDYEADRSRRYPVFYMHDGQNLFDGATSFIPGQEWQVDETAQS